MAEPIKVKLLDAQKNPILPETTADQVKTADGSNVEAKLAALQSTFASGIRQCGTVGTGGTVEALPADNYKLATSWATCMWSKPAEPTPVRSANRAT